MVSFSLFLLLHFHEVEVAVSLLMHLVVVEEGLVNLIDARALRVVLKLGLHHLRILLPHHLLLLLLHHRHLLLLHGCHLLGVKSVLINFDRQVMGAE